MRHENGTTSFVITDQAKPARINRWFLRVLGAFYALTFLAGAAVLTAESEEILQQVGALAMGVVLATAIAIVISSTLPRGTWTVDDHGVAHRHPRKEIVLPWACIDAVILNRCFPQVRGQGKSIILPLYFLSPDEQQQLIDFLEAKLIKRFDLRPRPNPPFHPLRAAGLVLLALSCTAFTMAGVILHNFVLLSYLDRWGIPRELGVFWFLAPMLGLGVKAFAYERRFPQWRERGRKYDVLDDALS